MTVVIPSTTQAAESKDPIEKHLASVQSETTAASSIQAGAQQQVKGKKELEVTKKLIDTLKQMREKDQKTIAELTSKLDELTSKYAATPSVVQEVPQEKKIELSVVVSETTPIESSRHDDASIQCLLLCDDSSKDELITKLSISSCSSLSFRFKTFILSSRFVIVSCIGCCFASNSLYCFSFNINRSSTPFLNAWFSTQMNIYIYTRNRAATYLP